MTPLSRGLGLRSEFAQALCELPPQEGIDFLELAPENWAGLGGRKRAQLDGLAQRYPLVAHGLSLSIGDLEPLDPAHLRRTRAFLDDYGIAIYSDHLSLSRDALGHLHELIPVPRYPQALAYLAERIDCVQSALGRQLVLENVSCYHEYPDQVPEGEFLAELAGRTGCGLLLDINNLYVNACNLGGDALALVRSLDPRSVVYFHIAGHGRRPDGTLLDTHGAPVAAAVRALGREVVEMLGPRPLLLERDNHIPDWTILRDELGEVHRGLCEGLHAAA
ncbi:DUF692 domain-containing protein [Bordetella trematum]|uniref:DUF692 domain-containing protein n=1 Tax=Bordetella trematum TaxID=123899 RepID=UPI003AF3B596